jgi:uncharacterized protein (DUF2141 family)
MSRRLLRHLAAGLVFSLVAWPALGRPQGGGQQGGGQQGARPQRDLAAQQALKPGTASIVGHVFAADSGRPIRLARVLASSPDIPDGGRSALTDETGRYEIAQLPAGRYTVAASKTGFVAVNFGQSRPLRSGKPFDVRDNQRVQGIDFRLPRGSVISGRVLDQDGEPLVGANVRATRERYVQGERRTEPTGGAMTDDRGMFRIYALAPGTYYVSATAQATDVGARMTFAASNVGGGVMSVVESQASDTPAAFTYAPTYYPGVPAFSDASPINLPVGQEVSGIDFTLQLVTAARVTGVVIGGAGAAANASVMLVPDDSRGTVGANYSGRVERDGSFSILNVPPGRYLAVARGQAGGPGGRGGQGQGTPTFAVVPLNVASPVTPGVSLMLVPGATLSGRVTFEGATVPAPAEIARIRIGLWTPAGGSLPMFNTSMNTTPRNDGTFTITDVPAGARMVRVNGAPSPWALKAVYLDGRDVTDSLFEIRAGETGGTVSIVFTDRASEVTGAVRDDEGRALTTGFTAIAFPVDTELWRPQSRFIQAARPDKTGVFTIRGLPPGEYFLQAIDDVDQGEWYDPTFLDALRRGAPRIVLQEGDKKSQDLKLVTIDR